MTTGVGLVFEARKHWVFCRVPSLGFLGLDVFVDLIKVDAKSLASIEFLFEIWKVPDPPYKVPEQLPETFIPTIILFKLRDQLPQTPL